MTPPNIDNFNIENKEDSDAKLAQAAGQPTKYFLFAEEFNSIKTYFAHLKQKIVDAFNSISFQSVTNGSGNNVTTNPVIFKKDDNVYTVFNSVDQTIEFWDLTQNEDYPMQSWSKDQLGVFGSLFGDNVSAGTKFSVSSGSITHHIYPGYNSFVDNILFKILRVKAPDSITGDNVQEYQNASGIIALRSNIDEAVAQLLNGAPSDGNTLKELNDKIIAISAIIGGSTTDGDSLVNTVAELLAVFAAYPEGTDIATVLSGKVNTYDIVNNLNQLVAGKVLDATQGKELYDLIVALTSLVGGKLDKQMAAYTLMANNTNTAANGTSQTFKSIANQVYTGTPVWVGSSAPSGSNDHSYSLAQIGNLVTVRINLVYGVGGSTITAVTIPLPSDCPAPFVASGGTPTNNRLISVGTGIMQTNFAPSTVPTYVILQTNSTNTGFNILVQRASANYQMVTVSVTYLTT